MATEHRVQLVNGRFFNAPAGTPLLDAAQAAGLNLEHSCRTGRCGSCKTQASQGRAVPVQAGMLSEAERAQGWLLTCTDAAASDLHLACDDVPMLAPARVLPARIDHIEPMTPDLLHVRLRLPPGSALGWRAGQYVNIVGPGAVRRSYSLASAAQGDDRLDFFISRVDGGEMSAYWFSAARQNDLLRIDGPRGSFSLRDFEGRDLKFLATGSGIAPIKAMLEELARGPLEQRPTSVELFWGARHARDLFWKPDFPGLGLRYVPVVSRPAAGWPVHRGHVQDVLLREEPDLSNAQVYACGSPAMIDSARQRLAAAGLAPRRFLADAFTPSSPLPQTLPRSTEEEKAHA
jgi:CDP-4-dehydro-6-deoxyglucose reductase, E3